MKKKHFLIVLPVLAILVGAVLTLAIRRVVTADRGKLSLGKTYALWLVEAEVADRPNKERPWDIDGSAPDLIGRLFYRGNSVLKTHVARNALVARWETVALSWKDLLEGEVSTGSIHKVAHVTVANSDLLEGKIFDEDLLNQEFVAGFSVPLAELRKGENILMTADKDAPIKRLTIMVVAVDPEEAGSAKSEKYHVPAVGFQWVYTDNGGPAEKNIAEFQKDFHQRIDATSKVVEDSAQKADQQIRAMGRKVEQFMDDLLRRTKETQ
jgi:hypothetical protein